MFQHNLSTYIHVGNAEKMALNESEAQRPFYIATLL